MESKKPLSKTKGNSTRRSSWKKGSLKTKGEHYDLKDIFDKINQEFFNSKLLLEISWARQGTQKARSYRRLGCYLPYQKAIRINPILDHLQIPPYFIEYIVYHEMLHAVYPPIKTGTRRWVHHAKFVEMEKKFPNYNEAKEWEKTHGKRHFF